MRAGQHSLIITHSLINHIFIFNLSIKIIFFTLLLTYYFSGKYNKKGELL